MQTPGGSSACGCVCLKPPPPEVMALRPRLRALRHARPPLRTLALAAALGVVMASGQAPFGLWWLTLAALVALVWQLSRSPGSGAAFWTGALAGLGYFAFALQWLIEPFMVQPERHAWMAPFALFLMSAVLALFWALASALAAWVAPGSRLRALVLVPALTGAEMLRGVVFTGFPWALLGHVWIDTPVVQLAAVVGAAGLTGFTLVLAALPFAGRGKPGQWVLALVSAVLLATVWHAGSLRLARPLPAPAHEGQVRLVQPNAPQHLKWRADMAEYFFARHLALTARTPAEGAPAPDLVIWSETAVPFLLEYPGAGLLRIADAAAGTPLVMGVQRLQDEHYYNSLALIGPDAVPQQVYDKHHLVPFGEYVPFADALLGPGYAGFASRQLSGYSRGPGPQLMDFGPLGRALPLICYEAVFPRHLRGTERPDWILQATNDAWFGRLTGPYQHLAQARLRAVEQGLPLVRSANTGISAVIGPRGEVLAALPLDVADALDAPLPAALPATPYARSGDAPWWLAVLAMLLAAALRRRGAIVH